jgi:integration host factor subunit beta
MTKSELIETVANKLKLPKGKAELIVNCVFDSMEASLKRGERIEIRGFGSFEIRNYKAYEGRNPRTGAKVNVKPKRLPFFKVGKELKERVNNGRLAQAAPAEQEKKEEMLGTPPEAPAGAGDAPDDASTPSPSGSDGGQSHLF